MVKQKCLKKNLSFKQFLQTKTDPVYSEKCDDIRVLLDKYNIDILKFCASLESIPELKECCSDLTHYVTTSRATYSKAFDSNNVKDYKYLLYTTLKFVKKAENILHKLLSNQNIFNAKVERMIEKNKTIRKMLISLTKQLEISN